MRIPMADGGDKTQMTEGIKRGKERKTIKKR
jgi:hypothetical protein